MSAFVELIHSEAEPSEILRLRYGTRADDPAPFVLTVMQQILPIARQDVVHYARRNKERLRNIAQVLKDRGSERQSPRITAGRTDSRHRKSAAIDGDSVRQVLPKRCLKESKVSTHPLVLMNQLFGRGDKLVKAGNT
jgi:hypothetical protein